MSRLSPATSALLHPKEEKEKKEKKRKEKKRKEKKRKEKSRKEKKRKKNATLAGWFSWLEHCPIHQKVVGLIPGQDTYRKQPLMFFLHINICISLSHTHTSINISLDED